ncbi:MAG: TRAP transporter substrate-binding protein [Pseudomonadota bacterium]
MASATTITLIGACEFNESYLYSRVLQRFAERIKEYYKGQVNFEFHCRDKNSLGKEEELAVLMSRGLIDFSIIAPSHVRNISEQVTLLDTPFLFQDKAHWNHVMESDALQPIIDSLLLRQGNSGLRILGFAGGGVRNMFFVADNVTPSLKKLQGMRIRVMDTPIQEKIFAALGMDPRPMPYLQLYDGLKNGLIPAAENEAASYRENKYYEVAPYMLLTKHAFTIRPLFFSESRFQKLPKDLQVAILAAGKEAAKWGRDQESEMDEKILKDMGDHGLIHMSNFPERDKLMKLAAPVQEQYAKKLGIEIVLENIEKLKSF